jgi:hypothetical protein
MSQITIYEFLQKYYDIGRDDADFLIEHGKFIARRDNIIVNVSPDKLLGAYFSIGVKDFAKNKGKK